MTGFWIVAAAMTGATVALLLWPLVRRPATSALPERDRFDLAVYRDQLAELDRDLARGVIEAAQAEAARAEIGRRMLAVAEAGPKPVPQAGTGRRRLALAIAVLVPVGVLAIYLPLGRPDLPGQPFAERDRHREGVPTEIVTAVERLAAKLAQQPDDLPGWLLLGQSYVRMGRPDQGAEALRHAVALSKGAPEVASALGEALTVANQGTVSAEALDAFAQAVAKQPDEPRARFYLSLAKAQSGDLKAALDGWSALLAGSPADAPWVPTVRERIEETAQRLGLDVAKVMPEPKPPAHPETAGAPGPSSGDVAAARAMAPADRQQMIRGMVEGLATRLDKEPGDIAGWLRLARAYEVLNEPEKRLDALHRASEQAPKRTDVLIAYGDALLGLAAGAGPEAPLPAAATTVFRSVLALEPENPQALWYLGLDAANSGKAKDAAALWQRLLPLLDTGSPERAEIEARLAKLEKGG
ncbi:MAG: c-type cytochrome biogenesis protein CcmI [Azospirillum sp.]|nr:c-type cytochrome biogenesis protein CcmI [Azospirillum sp.]